MKNSYVSLHSLKDTVQNSIFMPWGSKNKLEFKVLITNRLRVISYVCFTVASMLLAPPYADGQTTNMDAYIQYEVDFKQQEAEFIRLLHESNPGITKIEIKEELRQFYREHFDPPVFQNGQEFIGNNPNSTHETHSTSSHTASSNAFNQVPDAVEYQALRDLFESTNGSNWFFRDGWDYPNWKNPSTVSYLDFDDWEGISVVDGDVNGIDLLFNGLEGTLSSSIGDLRALTYLILAANDFTGSVPLEIKNLESLTHLNLVGTDFSGPFPAGILYLESLTYLGLGNNNFSGALPSEIGQLNALTFLDVWGSNFSGAFPAWTAQLESLNYLNLSYNNFSGPLPLEIGQLESLTYLNLYHNSFSGSLPPEIGQLQSLTYLGLGKNNFSGAIPSYLVNFPQLTNIGLNNNGFTSFPDFSVPVAGRTISSIFIEENKIGWEYIEPNIQNGINAIALWFQFAPQKLSDDTHVFWEIGSTGRISVSTGGTQNIYQWEKLATDSTWQAIGGQTTDELIIPIVALSDAGNYRLAVYNELAGGLSFGRAFYSGVFTIEVVESPPDPPSVLDGHICSNQAAVLTVTGTGSIQWYTDSLGGTPFQAGGTYTTPLLSATTTYFVSQVVSGIESDRVPISAIVGPVFTATQNESLCRGESVPIVIEGGNLTVDWGSEIGALNSFVAQPDTTTTYSYSIEDEFGCTASGQVTITVNDPADAEILPTVPVCPGQTATLEAIEVTGATYTWEPGSLTGRIVDVVVNELQEYTLTVTGANGCTAQASILPEIQTIAVASEDREICVVDSVTLVAEGGDSYVWSTGDTIPEINFSPSAPGTYTFTVTATKDGCSASDDVVVIVNAFCPGTPISFMARAISTTEIELNWQEPPGNHTEYVIERQDGIAGIVLPKGTTFWRDSGLQPGTVYHYRIYSKAGTLQSEMRFARARTFTPNQNYIMETEVLTEGISDPSFVPNLNYHQRNSTWNYLNGLGSNMQTVVEGASPSEKDVVQPIIYDEYGMRSKQYLSYTIAQTTEPGNFRDDAEQETTDFYANPPTGIASTSFPYAETVFDTSPQNKVLEQGSTGEAWQVSTGNTIKIDRTTNAASDVLHWKISGNQLEAAGYYPAAQLKKTITANEDDETVLLYEDMLGRELMRKVERAAGDIITYFVYNNRGSLLYRITPNVISGLTGSPPFTIDQNTLVTQCYSYRYDAQEKLIEEKWPDQEAIYYVYDQWDRLVLSQSGNQRQKNQWTFTKYDRFDRPVLTGLLDTTDFTRSGMQSAIDNYYTTGGNRYEVYQGMNGTVHGYTNDSYPAIDKEQAYLSVTYYDSYDFIQSDTLFGASYAYDASALGCQNSPQGEYCFPSAPLKILRGKVTGSKTKVLNQDQWLPGVVYYDDDGRTIQAIAQNHTGGIDRASTLHNFAGWPLMTYSTLDVPGTDSYAIQRKFVYDHAGRLKEGYHELFKNDVGQGEKFLAENVYNELGQLIEKNLHVEQDIPLQSVDYRYNIRGWLQSINNVHFSVDSRNNDVNDLFGMEILYQNPLNGVQPGEN